MPPDSLHYRVIYDAATTRFTDGWAPAVGLVILGGIAFVAYQRRGKMHGLEGMGLVVMAGLAICWTVFAASAMRGERRSLLDALASGRYTVVEGRVRDFEPDDPAAHRPETWAVESRGRLYRYRFTSAELTPGFRETSAYGGPIYQGLRVRIADVDGHIARLEIAE